MFLDKIEFLLVKFLNFGNIQLKRKVFHFFWVWKWSKVLYVSTRTVIIDVALGLNKFFQLGITSSKVLAFFIWLLLGKGPKKPTSEFLLGTLLGCFVVFHVKNMWGRCKVESTATSLKSNCVFFWSTLIVDFEENETR